jgi:hypothetical protein
MASQAVPDLSEVWLIAQRSAAFRAFAEQSKRIRVFPGSPRPITDVFALMSAFVTEDRQKFIPRMLSFGLAIADGWMIILRNTLCNVLGLSNRYVLSELPLIGWTLVNIEFEQIGIPDFFRALLPIVYQNISDTETVCFATFTGRPSPEQDVETDLLSERSDDRIQVAPIAEVVPVQEEKAILDETQREFTDPSEVLDVMETVPHDALQDVPSVRPVRRRFRAAKCAFPKRTPFQSLTRLHAKCMRLDKKIKQLIKDLAERDREIARLDTLLHVKLATCSPDLPVENASIPIQILQELTRQMPIDPKLRRFSSVLVTFSFSLHAVSARAYRQLREVLPFPSSRRLQDLARPEKAMIAAAVDQETGSAALPDYLRDYRIRYQLVDQRVLCTLAFDATSVTATGLPRKETDAGSSFAFLMLPLDHRYSNLLVRSIVRQNGKITDDIIFMKDELFRTLYECGFSCMFIATDGDNKMDAIHETMFRGYAQTRGDLGAIVAELIRGGDHILPLPASDLLHLMKNATSRLALGALAFNGGPSREITGDSVTENVLSNRSRGVFQARKPLDLLKDDLAIHAFTLDNLLSLWDHGDITGAYYLLPYVALSHAIRNRHLSQKTRFGLLQTAFDIFFDFHKYFPLCGISFGITERANRHCRRKTLWTKNMCRRACNLCVDVQYAVLRAGKMEGIQLALERIGSHDCECHFGTTRSVLRGDTRWTNFFQAQVTAVLIQRTMKEQDLHPYIRRFKTEAGCTLMDPEHETIDIEFLDMGSKVRGLVRFLGEGLNDLAKANGDAVIEPFRALASRLGEIQWTEKARKSGPLAGGGIQYRLFTLGEERQARSSEQVEFLSQLADE